MHPSRNSTSQQADCILQLQAVTATVASKCNHSTDSHWNLSSNVIQKSAKQNKNHGLKEDRTLSNLCSSKPFSPDGFSYWICSNVSNQFNSGSISCQLDPTAAFPRFDLRRPRRQFSSLTLIKPCRKGMPSIILPSRDASEMSSKKVLSIELEL